MNPRNLDPFDPTSRAEHIRAARSVKLAGLLRAITLLCSRRGRPVRAAELLRWDEVHWELLALKADVTVPSVETRSLVVQHVAERECAALAANERRAL